MKKMNFTKIISLLKLLRESEDDYLNVSDSEAGREKTLEPSHAEKMAQTKTFSPEEFAKIDKDELDKWEPESKLGKVFKNHVEVESLLLKSYDSKRFELEIYITFRIIPSHKYKRLHTSVEFEGKNIIDANLKKYHDELVKIEDNDIFIEKLNEIFKSANIRFVKSPEQKVLGIDLNGVKKTKDSITIPCYNVARLATKQWDLLRRQIRKAVGEDFLNKNREGSDVYGGLNLHSFLSGMDKRFGLKTVIFPELKKIKENIDKQYLSRYKTYYSYFDWDSVPIQWEDGSYRDKYTSASVAEKQFPFIIILKFKLPASLKNKEDIEKRLEVKVEDFKKAVSNSDIFKSDEYFEIKP
jgi:hypothetical protein